MKPILSSAIQSDLFDIENGFRMTYLHCINCAYGWQALYMADYDISRLICPHCGKKENIIKLEGTYED